MSREGRVIIRNNAREEKDQGARLRNTLVPAGGVPGFRAAAAVVFLPLLLPVSEAMALLNVPFFRVPVAGEGAVTGTGAGSDFSLILSCLATEDGTGNFLDAGAAMAVCGLEGGGFGFAGDLLTMVVFSLLVLLSEASLGRRARRLVVSGCGADAAESRAVVVGAVAGRLAGRVFPA